MYQSKFLQSIFSFGLATAFGVFPSDAQDQRSAPEMNHPNILWITAEDMSRTLGCYGDS